MSGCSYSKHPDAMFADEALDHALWRGEFAESGLSRSSARQTIRVRGFRFARRPGVPGGNFR